MPAGRMKRRIAEACCWLVVGPLLLAYRLRLVGFLSVGQALAVVPGRPGVLLRRVWYSRTLAKCGRDLFVDWGAVFRTPLTQVGDHVYVGVRSWLGECVIGSDTMLSGPTLVLSGANTHGIERGRLMRLQEVRHSMTIIGADVWTGAGSVIMADLAQGTVVGAGAVVTRATEEYSVVAGVPARRIGERP
jgi:acetyltransferase-like isoleucine patch superfamily enzyme